jgi:hypothetical protein
MNKNLKKLIICKSNTVPNTIIIPNINTKYIIIKPVGGLSNMLRVLFSYYYKALAENKKLKVIWQKSQECPGYFLNYFEPIENVIFDNTFDKNYYNTCNTIDCSQYNVNNIYEKLKLLDFMEKKVKNIIEQLDNNFIAVHIRRTDHIDLAKLHNKYTTDKDFINFIDKYDTYNLYLATDNRKTQQKFYNKYKNRIKVITFIEEKNSLRQTLLEEAIIDMFTCSHAKFFLGSGFSSFSSIINKLIQLRNI